MSAHKTYKRFSHWQMRLYAVLFAVAFSACASKTEKFLESGSIILSRQLPEIGAPEPLASRESGEVFAPLVGYIPPTIGFLPAANETWLSVDRAAKKLTLYKGNDVVKTLQAEGNIGLEAGVYALQHKQKRAAWYAPDAYFQKRNLPIPGSSDRSRYRRGALGQYVLYPTTTFPIHSAPIWSDDVGGLRVAQADLSSIYFALPVGATIVVK